MHHAKRLIFQELRSGGVASAVHILWQLRRQSPGLWHELAADVQNCPLTQNQFFLIASLWELSKEGQLDDIAPRLGALPDHLCNSFR